jgi:predicted site-specific integrase-resolvase
VTGMIERRAEPLREFCASVGISYDTGFRAYKSGVLRVIRAGKRILVPRDEIERVLREGLVARNVGNR